MRGIGLDCRPTAANGRCPSIIFGAEVRRAVRLSRHSECTEAISASLSSLKASLPLRPCVGHADLKPAAAAST
jgi:hypothetical protein